MNKQVSVFNGDIILASRETTESYGIELLPGAHEARYMTEEGIITGVFYQGEFKPTLPLNRARTRDLANLVYGDKYSSEVNRITCLENAVGKRYAVYVEALETLTGFDSKSIAYLRTFKDSQVYVMVVKREPGYGVHIVVEAIEVPANKEYDPNPSFNLDDVLDPRLCELDSKITHYPPVDFIYVLAHELTNLLVAKEGFDGKFTSLTFNARTFTSITEAETWMREERAMALTSDAPLIDIYKGYKAVPVSLDNVQ